MKKLLLIPILLLLFAVQASAWMSPVVCGGGVESEGCDTCGGDPNPTFVWYCNSATVGDTGSSPCGCSDNDTSATQNGDATISGGAVVCNDDSSNGGDYYSFDVADIFNEAEGSVIIKFEITTWGDWWIHLWNVEYDSNNRIRLLIPNDNDVALYWTGGGTTQYINTQDIDSDNISTSTTYYAICRWTKSDVNPNLYLNVYSDAETSVVSGSNNNNLADMTNPSGEALYVGNKITGADNDFKIYYIKMYDTYSGATTSDF